MGPTGEMCQMYLFNISQDVPRPFSSSFIFDGTLEPTTLTEGFELSRDNPPFTMPILTSVESHVGPLPSVASASHRDLESGRSLLSDDENVVLTMTDAPFDASKPQDQVTLRFNGDVEDRLGQSPSKQPELLK